MLSAIVRRPLTPSEVAPVLVLLHGLGADERDLMGLAPQLDPRLLIVSIRAPMGYGNGGYAWFDVSWDASGVRVSVDQAIASRELLLETLKSLPEAVGIPPSKIILGGFSQGAMMSLGVALAAPELLAGVLLMSGRLLPEFTSAEISGEIEGMPFLVQHGTQDAILPVQGSREVRDFLRDIEADVTYREYEMGHEITQESLDDARQWMAGVIKEGLAPTGNH